jgi:hypothetical protein
MTAEELKNNLELWIHDYKDIAERHALAETPQESTKYILSLIRKAVEGARLTPEQFNIVMIEYARHIMASNPIKEWNFTELMRRMSDAQLDAVLKLMGGE